MTRFYRTLTGPAVIGVAVWCAAGTIAVVSNTGSAARVAALAPWWVGVLAVAVAACVPAWRARPVTALPALFSTLPWWPVPLPAVALLWTGPLAWAPIGAALCAAEGGRVLNWLARLSGANGRDDGQAATRATWLAAAGSLVIAVGGAWAANPLVPGGDEPHYLVITQSLLKDGDLQIANNHEARDYAAFFEGTLDPHSIVPGQNGAMYSIHAPGVSALVLPAFAMLGFRGAQSTLMLLFAVTGVLVWRTAWRFTGDASAAWFAWAAVAGSTTMATMSFMVFPDAPGACAVAAATWLLVTHREASTRALVAVSAALAVLPWLHTRFSVLAGVLGLALTVMLLADGSRPMAARLRRALMLTLIPIASALAWFSMFYVIYGSVDPRVAYGPDPPLRPWIWGAVAGLFVDQQFGLMAYAPVLLMAIIGPFVGSEDAASVRAARERRVLSTLCLGVALVYAMAVATYWMWWAGVPGLPARFLTAIVPLLAVPLAAVWVRATGAGRTMLLALLMVSLAITLIVLGVDRSAMILNFRDGQAQWLRWLNPVVNLPRAWPSFFWTTNAAFLRHVAMLGVLIAALWAGLKVITQRWAGDPVATRLAVAALMPAALMVVIEAAWLVTGSAALNPARAQLAAHAAGGAGRSVWKIGPGARPWNPETTPLRIRQDEPQLTDDPSTFVLGLLNVPGGAYRLNITSGPLTGVLTVALGRSAQPLQRFVVAPNTTESRTLWLPAGALVFNVEADTPELARQVRATLITASPARAVKALARQSGSYPGGDVFFLDGNVVPDGEGFWVREGRTTDVVFTHGVVAANRTRVLHLRNGDVANVVTLRLGVWQHVVSLAAGQEENVSLPVADAIGTWPLTITAASGRVWIR